ncbi:RES family NAD+ phosphorylase [Taibaiella koreensis]|uniref:RES family NAD+ phosphorylase n=1 Tax=Taibaiella koreensis TaxID=1268548 RepID=UPI000E59C72C|nr:RES family NAD+ phosphorylase [Taibaiella koreensis]
MVLYRISSCRYIDDLSGTGAALYGGRWNGEGVYILYTAGSPSLAMLECLVHFGGRVVGDYCQIALEIPEESIQELRLEDLPDNWRENPAPDVLKAYGNRFIAAGKYLMLKVPSVLVPDESNYLLNPQHAGFKKLRTLVKSKIRFDERLIKRANA